MKYTCLYFQEVALLPPAAVTVAPPVEDEGEDGEFTCEWKDCHVTFKRLQQLVNHVHAFHVKAAHGEDYLCHWKSCPRKGKGFNAKYVIVINHSDFFIYYNLPLESKGLKST